MIGPTRLDSIEVVVALVALVLIVALAAWREAFRRRCARRWRGELPAAPTGETPAAGIADPRGGASPMAAAARGRTRRRAAGRSGTGLAWRPLLLALAAAATAAAAVVASTSQPDPEAGRGPAAIVFALDVSRSMEVADVRPSRLQAARRLITRVVDEAAPGAAGLVVFAGEAALVCPLTSDLDAFRLAMGEVPAVGDTLPGGSALAAALTRAAAAFGSARGRKVVVLVSDGEDTGAAGPLAGLVRRLASERVTVVAVGLGTAAGVRMPASRPDASDGSGEGGGGTHLTRLDAPRLQQVARATGGAYYDGADAQAAPRLVSQLRAPAARAGLPGGPGRLTTALLAMAFLCLVVEWLASVAGSGT